MTRPLQVVLLLGAFASLCRASPFGPPQDSWSGRRQYAPDREAEIHHLALDVTPDFSRRVIRGEAILTFAPIAKPLAALKLDAVDLDIEAVDSTEKIDAFEVTDDHLVITFATAIAPEREATVTIRYHAQPRKGL